MSVLMDDLRRTLSSDPGSVVFIVGSGVSVGALRGGRHSELASWVGLLRDGLQRVHDLGIIDERARSLSEQQLGLETLQAYLGVADLVSHGLGAPHGGEFSRWLRETVGSFQDDIRDRSVLDALSAHQRRGALLATTNYDHLLEEASGMRPTTWRRHGAVERVLRGEERRVLHLHGEWEDPDSIVLGTRSYVDVTRDAHAKTVLGALRTERTFVFVGCGAGLQDPNMGSFLHWTAEVFAHSEVRHFRLCLKRELDALRREHPPGQRIFAVPYGEEHSELATFLSELVQGATRVAPIGYPTRRGVEPGIAISRPFEVESAESAETLSDLTPGGGASVVVRRKLALGALVAGGVAVVLNMSRGAESKVVDRAGSQSSSVPAGIGLADRTCVNLVTLGGVWAVDTKVTVSDTPRLMGVQGFYSMDIQMHDDCVAAIVVMKIGDSSKRRYEQVYQDRKDVRLSVDPDGVAVADFEVWLGPNKAVDQPTNNRSGWHYRFKFRIADQEITGTWQMFADVPGASAMSGTLEGRKTILGGGKFLPSPYR